MKRLTAILLALTLVLAFAACGQTTPAESTASGAAEAPSAQTAEAPAEPEATEQSAEEAAEPASALEEALPEEPEQPADLKALADDYEYAYWLGYIYRCECHMHDESSRMVYGAFNERFMRSFYEKLAIDEDTALTDCAPEICRRLDALLVGKLWK